MMDTTNVKGDRIVLADAEVSEVHQAAWWLHRPGKCIVTLRGPLMCRILGRLYHQPCGSHIIWRTCGRDVVAWVLAHTTEHDLALIDWAERFMWAGNQIRNVENGRPVSREYEPVAYRDSEQMPDAEYRQMLDRLDVSGRLAALERELAELEQVAVTVP